MSRIITVLGGISSGKSNFAQNLAYDMGKKRAYIATAEITDDDMNLKVQKHIASRGNDWCTFENFADIDNLIINQFDHYDTALLDCVTNMINNLMYHSKIDFETCDNDIFVKFCADVKKYVQKILNSMKSSKCKFVIITNEIGLCVIPANRYTRRFVQLHGEINQIFTKISDEVYFVVSGTCMKIK
ncbi:MAG: bifunctional adenosylcobinamide kinase/adenosylcobinamide-phosphate guanylyltransferase [Peptoanaerobacter stomatis]